MKFLKLFLFLFIVTQCHAQTDVYGDYAFHGKLAAKNSIRVNGNSFFSDSIHKLYYGTTPSFFGIMDTTFNQYQFGTGSARNILFDYSLMTIGENGPNDFTMLSTLVDINTSEGIFEELDFDSTYYGRFSKSLVYLYADQSSHSFTANRRGFDFRLGHNEGAITFRDSNYAAVIEITNTDSVFINGAVKINDGTQGANYVFTSDANGKGAWHSNTLDDILTNGNTASVNDIILQGTNLALVGGGGGISLRDASILQFINVNKMKISAPTIAHNNSTIFIPIDTSGYIATHVNHNAADSTGNIQILQKIDTAIATIGETSFRLSFTPSGDIMMFRNGILLDGVYSNTGTSVTYTGVALAAGDKIKFIYIH